MIDRVIMNGWSIVESPVGISLRPVNADWETLAGEICVSLVDGVITARIYDEGLDLAGEVSASQDKLRITSP